MAYHLNAFYQFQEEIFRLRNEVTQLTEANNAAEVMKERTLSLESQLEEKTRDYQISMEVNRRLQSEMKQVQTI